MSHVTDSPTPSANNNDVKDPSTTSNKSTSSQQPKWSHSSSRLALRPALLAIFITIAMYTLVFQLAQSTLPDPRTFKPSPILPFDHTNAIRHITHMGSRMRYVSSNALHDALIYIQKEVEDLITVAEQNGYLLEVDFFRSGPSTFSTTISTVQIRHSYDNLTSIVVRLSPNEYNNEESLLINAHVDSAIGSPGVSDELSGVGIMMELIRGIVSTNNNPIIEEKKVVHQHKLKRPIIFLFNGAEEVILQGAHSFITQHKWSTNIICHINLESLGSGREYHLFRLGPNNPWLAHAYANSVTNPFASVTATDVFETKLIPGETDFRVFNDVGGIPGFDFVFLENGYIYHTVYDDLDHLNEQGILHAGITIYQLTMELAGTNDAIGQHLHRSSLTSESSKIIDSVRNFSRFISSKIKTGSKDKKYQSSVMDGENNVKVVFFDILHLFTIVYDEEIATLINLTIMLFSIVVWWIIHLRKWKLQDWYICLRMCIAYGFAFIGGLMSCTYAAIVYNKMLSCNLIWYGSTFKSLILFCPPMIVGMLTSLSWALPKKITKLQYEYMLFPLSMSQLLICFFLTRNSIMGAYVPGFLLLASTYCVMQGEFAVSPMIRHIQIMAVYSLLCNKMVISVLSAALPLFGRVKVGDGRISGWITHDVVAGWVVTVTTMVYIGLPCIPILSYYAPALRRLRKIGFVSCLWIAVLFIIVMPRMIQPDGKLTPYTKDAPKRLSFIHFYMKDMKPSSSILQMASTDSVSIDLERLLEGVETEDSDIGTMYDKPMYRNGEMDITPFESYHPFGVLVQEVHYIRVGNVPTLHIPDVTVKKEEYLEDIGKWNVSVEMVGHGGHQLTFRIRSKDSGSGVVSSWSLDSSLDDRSGYVWVKHHGSHTMKWWMVVDEASESEKERAKVTTVVSNVRLGCSASPKDLAVIKRNTRHWESAMTVVSVASQLEL